MSSRFAHISRRSTPCLTYALTLAFAVAIPSGCGDGGGTTAGTGGAGARGGAGGMGGVGGAGGTGGNGGMGARPLDGILVDTPPGQIATDSADGYCDILEAVAAASTGRTVRECANPKGSTDIILKAGATYRTGRTLRFATATERPIRIQVDDVAGGPATITAASPWLLDPGDPPTGCLAHVSGGPLIKATHVTLTQDTTLTSALTGVCLERGTVDLRYSRVTGFKKGGLSAVCLPDKGCDFDAGHFSMLQIASTLVDGNATDGDGGGIYSEGFGATVVAYHSSIVNNQAAGAGGGVYFGGGWDTHVLRASTVSGNRANVGGGVMVKFACSNTYLHVFHSTITNNTAEGTGGGIQFEPNDLACSKQDVTVYSSIVAGNHSATTLESNINASWWTDDPTGNLGIFACIEGSIIHVAPDFPRPEETEGICLMDTRDPRLGPLMSMGGVGNLPVHPLLSGSPALDVAMTEHKLDDQRDDWIPVIDPPLSAEWTLWDRNADGNGDGRLGSDFGAIEMSPRWQTELLQVAAKGASAHRVITAPPGLDRGAGTEYAAAGAINEFVTYRLPIPEPGFYDITAGVVRTPSGGKMQIAVADAPTGPWTDLGEAQETFASSQAFAALGPFAAPLFATAGERLIRFTVTGKNAASGGFALSLDYVDARRSTKACPVGQVAAGANHTCALMAAGGVRCWGANQAGQLGDGSKTAAWRAPIVDVTTGISAIAAGARHVCALTAAGGVRCWGANQAGQLGDGTTNERATPPTTDIMTGVKAIAAGMSHTCALTTAGGVRCWGANESGQLGDGTTTSRSAPPTADALTGVQAIAAGESVTCALTMTGGVRCWGKNTFGQLGDGTTMDRASPPASDLVTGIASLAVGGGHTCAVTTAGGVRCWGRNNLGQLGDGMAVDVLSPPSTDVLAGAREVAVGSQFTCALTTAGGVRCWGYNSDGQIGDDTPNAAERFSPAATDILADVQGLAAGHAHVCARMKSGGVRCWGANADGQLGDGLVPDRADTPPPGDVVTFTGTCR